MINKEQLETLIDEALHECALHSPIATRLLLGTCAVESAFGTYLTQLNNGPARGVFQMEEATFYDIINNYLTYKKPLLERIKEVCGIGAEIELTPDMLVYNMKLAILFTRVHYLRVPKALPISDKGLAPYWKFYYNTKLGQGTQKGFNEAFKKYVGDLILNSEDIE